MSGRIFKAILVIIFISALSACGGNKNVKTQITVKPSAPLGWARTEMSESDFRTYFDENSKNLDPIEGIWTLAKSTKWVNIVSGLKGVNKDSNIYTLAVKRDESDKNLFKAWIIKARYPVWQPGLLKAKYIKSALKGVYMQKWYMSDFSSEERTVSIQKNAIIRTVESSAEYPINQEDETIKLKLYPAVEEETEEDTSDK